MLHGRSVRKLESRLRRNHGVGARRAYDPAAGSGDRQGRRFRQCRQRAAGAAWASSTQSSTPPCSWARWVQSSIRASMPGWRRQRVNLLAPFGLTRALLSLLRAASDASVVFTLDTRGEDPNAYWGAYAVAKAGLSALLRILADEWESRADAARQRRRTRTDAFTAARAERIRATTTRYCRRPTPSRRFTCTCSTGNRNPKAVESSTRRHGCARDPRSAIVAARLRTCDQPPRCAFAWSRPEGAWLT